MNLVAVLSVNTSYESKALNYVNIQKDIKLFSSVEKAVQYFKYSDLLGDIELIKISDTYFEFKGIDREGYPCEGSIYRQCIID